MRILYGAPPSPFVRKVRIVLAEKGLPYVLEPVVHHLFPPTFDRVSRTISPLGKIPAYRDDDVTLADSSVICAYLERAHPDPPLYPTDASAYARALWFEEYGDSGLAPVLTMKVFVRKVLLPRFLNQPPDEADLGRIVEEELPPLFDYLESQVGGDRPVVGSDFSIGDIGIATQFVNLRHYAGIDIVGTRWPKLVAYLDSVEARPSFRAVLDEERARFGTV
jgi:glutathione S-transferase